VAGSLFFAADLILKVDVEQKQIPFSTLDENGPQNQTLESTDIAFATAEQSSFQSNFEDVEQSQLFSSHAVRTHLERRIGGGHAEQHLQRMAN
jgi:hypothetical protein